MSDVLRVLNTTATMIGWLVMLVGLACLVFTLMCSLDTATKTMRRRLRERRCDRWWREKKESAGYRQLLDDMWRDGQLHKARHFESIDDLLESIR